ncbi:MAG TPA: hypothetical protein VGZ22_20645, partial [Isosphaeraceae bacterium]|nr:hypothetical protein [Isosphaeraceae bacterium]
MRRHDQTRGRGRLRACAWFVLVALLASGVARAHEEPSELTSPAVETIDLAADRIREWTVDGQQWVVLEGNSAVLQGVDGVRAERAVVKVLTQSNLGKVVHSVEIYAEGKVQGTDRPG